MLLWPARNHIATSFLRNTIGYQYVAGPIQITMHVNAVTKSVTKMMIKAKNIPGLCRISLFDYLHTSPIALTSEHYF